MQYAIYEENLERLEKKLKTIENKCSKYGLEFSYERVGEEFRKVQDGNGNSIIARYIIVDVLGCVIHNGWKFIATIEHTENGNIVRQFIHDIKIPDSYYSSYPICEHCNTNRRRKDTYLIYNDETSEWKQVGKSCLREFTHGIDADEVSRYISYFDELIKGEEPYGTGFRSYYEVIQIVRFAFETVKHFGYQANTDFETYPTKARCMDYYNFLVNGDIEYGMEEKLQLDMERTKFNPDSEDIQKIASDAISWITGVENVDFGYLSNLQVVCSSEYCTSKDLGILISLPAAYNRHVKEEEDKAEHAARLESEGLRSEYVGQVGDKLSFVAKDLTLVYSCETIYGWNYMYKFYDEEGRVYMWSTSKGLNSEHIAEIKVSGKVKKHEEFKGVKQTWLTRCKLTEVA